MAVNTWDAGAGSTTWRDAGNWNTTGVTDRIPTADDDVIIPDTSGMSHRPEIGADETINSLAVLASGVLAGNTSYSVTIDGENGAGLAADIDGTLDGVALNLIFTGTHGTEVDLVAASGTVRDVTINKGGDELRLVGATTISGDVTVTAGQLSGQTADHSFGSLTIASGATYSATSGTTTITGKSGAGYSFNQAGTFTHNKGLVKIDFNTGNTNDGTSTIFDEFYDYEIDMNSSGYGVTNYDKSNATMVVLNNLTVTQGKFKFGTAGDALTVHGLTTVTSNGLFGEDTAPTGTHTFNGLVTNSGQWDTSSGTNNFNGGLRQLNGTVGAAGFHSTDTLTINGSGGILEGNLDDAIINVNTDVPYEANHTGFLAGTAQTITIPHDNDLDGGSAYTFMAWVKSSATSATTGAGGVGNSSFATIAQINDSWKLGLHDSGKPWFYWFGSSTVNENTWGNATTQVGAGWTHVCVVANTSGGTVNGHANNTATLYQNGVARSSTLTIGGNASDESGSILIHSKADDDEILYGNVIDVKLYNAILSADEVKIAASKINKDSTLISSTAPQIWAKLNTGATGSVASAIGGTATVGTGMDDAIPYDAFSVNVQDNTTTTDGAVTVTQGKLECLSLTTPHFDGDDNFVELGSQAGDMRLSGSNGAVCLWFECDDVSGGDSHKRLFDKSDGGSAANGYGMTLNGTTLNFYIGGGSKGSYNGNFTSNTWHHLIWTWDGTTHYAYVDGVEVMATTDSATPSSSTTGARIGSWNHSTGREFDGSIRDVRIYDYGLSADQASSLYSGSYNVTPLHWWKLDDSIQGTPTTTAVNLGTSSDAVAGNKNGVLTGFTATSGHLTNASDWNNGTLDLDSTLTIAANGTLSAPRGDLDLSGNFLNYGTYTHNSGTLEITTDWVTINNATSTAATTFNNLTCTYSAQISDRTNPVVVEKILSIASGKILVIRSHPSGGQACTLTMGKSTATTVAEGGSITGSGLIDFNNTTAIATVQGASQLYPCVVDSGADWDWDSGDTGNATLVDIANLDYQVAMTTGGSGVTVKLTGDCEFDSVTISTGDTLDVNGQRMECSGQMNANNGGIFDLTGGSMLVCQRVNIQGTGNDDVLTDANTIIWNTGGAGVSTSTTAVDNSGVIQGTFIFGASGHKLDGFDFVGSKLIIMEGLNTSDA